MAAQLATPAEAVESLRQALTAALGALGGVAPATAVPEPISIPTPEPIKPPPPVVEEVPIIAKAPEPKPNIPPTPDGSRITHHTSHVPHHASPPPDKPWLPPTSKTPLAKEKWSGKVREITLGATKAQGGTRAKTVTVGGETAMPFLDFEGVMPHPPVIAVEIRARKPADWSPLLLEAWGDVVADPVRWAQAAEKAGAGLIQLSLGLENGVDTAVAAVRSVLQATGLPLIVVGPGQADKDNELLAPIADAFKGERLALGICEDKNYRTIVAAAMANDHLVIARTAMDVNLAKQLNILISDMGLPLDRVIMDPTTGALGYGFEYGYSVMERLRLAALQGDGMTQLPMMVTPGEEAWKTKEAKVGVGVPAAWGDWAERAITWETVTAVMLIESGANILTLRHPETVRRVGAAIADLTKKA
ncbi:MAG: acetyl-CoA decarbonylase/synthase complex subunit delta [Chloroflexi bacterium]|nr:acetyl-CoA decarbonylase/synthase complex subunit delta [Ardenticatenaceae bacterium]NOG33800.1 acetyl-CoA decarbonylase/synthase complex subunit delta [Chloroflexota bacterium]